MFYGNQIISKKDPLSLIFLAGSTRGCKKLSKKKVLNSNIEELSKQIVQPQLQFALRISGTLLLGIVVVYQRKLQYLLAGKFYLNSFFTIFIYLVTEKKLGQNNYRRESVDDQCQIMEYGFTITGYRIKKC